MNTFLGLIANFIAVTIVLTFHEFAHAFAAYRSGDPTPKWNKRLSLNPLRHFDPIGLVCFTLVGFGWAKPVPINPDNFKHYRRGLAFTASAGVIMNYLMAFLLYPLYLVVINYVDVPVLSEFLESLTFSLFAFNLSFCVFNLLPLYPLDGFRIVEAVSKKHGKVYQFLRKYGYYILLFLIVESFLCRIFTDYLGIGVIGETGYVIMNSLNILGWIMKFATKIFGFPIMALWGTIFGMPLPAIWGLISW